MSKDKRVEKVKFKTWRPFGPQIMTGQIPDAIYKEFYGIVEEVLKEKEKTHNPYLAGRIEEEWTVPQQKLYQTQTEEFLGQIVIKYAQDVCHRMFADNQMYSGEFDKHKIQYDNADFDVHRISGWVNSMVSGEYNPIHHHPYCNVTSIFFFTDVNKKFIDEIIAPNNNLDSNDEIRIDESDTDDGSLELTYSSYNYWQTGSVRIKPKKGLFLLFPADLLHCVYPFKSKSNRISASFNFIVKSNISGLNFGDR